MCDKCKKLKQIDDAIIAQLLHRIALLEHALQNKSIQVVLLQLEIEKSKNKVLIYPDLELPSSYGV